MASKRSAFCSAGSNNLGERTGKSNMVKTNKVVAAGHICLDLTPVFPQGTRRGIGDIFVPGSLVGMEGMEIHTGGSVANTGLALRMLGANVTLIGKVGDDALGGLVLELLRKYSAQEGIVVEKGGRTSYSVVLAPPGVDRIFLHDPGANHTFSYEDLDFDAVGRAQLFHFGYPPAMRRMYLSQGAELLKIFRKVRSLGVMTSLDMVAVDETSEAAQTDWPELLRELMPSVDFFLPSAEELCFLLDRSRHAQWVARAKQQGVQDVTEVITRADIEPLAQTLIDWGAKAVLIKCGAPGLYLRTGSGDTLSRLGERFVSWADLELFEPSYVPDRFAAATGAGDVAIAGFLKGVLDGLQARECLQIAAAAGAQCVTAYDALGGLLPAERLYDKIRAGWKKSSSQWDDCGLEG